MVERYAYARLRDPSHVLPWQGRMFGKGADFDGFERVDSFDGFVCMLIADGSLEYAEPPRPTAKYPDETSAAS